MRVHPPVRTPDGHEQLRFEGLDFVAQLVAVVGAIRDNDRGQVLDELE